MATTAITEDFVTKSGLNVQGTSIVTSSTGQSDTLQVDGGAAIAKNLIVGTTATVGGSLFVNENGTIGQRLDVGTTATISGNLFVYGHSRIVTMTATGVVSIIDTTLATTGTTGALVVSGGAYIGKNLVVLSTVSSTGTAFNNSLYVAGGVGIDKNLVVGGTSVFHGDAIFNGTATYVYSANTVYTDNILELHTPSTGTPGVWSVDDGKDIGLRFHYYSGANTNAALVLANDTKYLEWYVSGAEGTDTFANGTYGTFKTGNIILTGDTNATTTQSGALVVAGGVGVAGDIYVGGTITAPLFIGTATTATNIGGGTRGAIPYQSSTGTTTLLPIGSTGTLLFSNGDTPYWDSLGVVIVPDYAGTATNIRYGEAMGIPFQTNTGTTAFEYNFRYDFQNDTLRTVNAVFTGTTNASNTISGALQVVGGVGIGQDLYVGRLVNATNIVASAITATNLEVGNVGYGSVYLTQYASVFAEGSSSTANVIMQASANNLAYGIGIATLGSFSSLYSSGAIYFNTGITLRDRDTPQGGSTFMTLSTAGVLTLSGTVESTSTTTGALTVAGGVGIQGDIYIGGQTTVHRSIILDNSTINIGSLEKPVAELFVSSNALYLGNVVLSSTGSQLVVTSLVGPASLTIPTIYVTSSTVSNSTDTGALQVVGGVGIGGNLYVGNRGNIGNTEHSTGTDSGAFVVAGGVGIGGGINVGDRGTFGSITESTSTNTGALVVAGGVGIGGTLYVNTTSYINNSQILTVETIGNYNVKSITAGTDTVVSTSTGDVLIWNNSTLQSVTDRGNTTDNSILITDITDAISTNSGALQVAGGVGIGGNLYVGNSVTVTNNLYIGNSIIATSSTFDLINTNATTVNFAGVGTSVNIGATSGSTTVRNDLHVTGNLLVQGTSTIVDSTVTNISDPILTLGAGPNNADLIINDDKDRGIAFKHFNGTAKTGFFGYQNSTGYLTFFTSATFNDEIVVPAGGTTKGAIDINLAGGTAQSLVYQSSTDITNFLAAGEPGYLLQTNGVSTAPSWVPLSTLVITTATNLENGTAGQVPYQTSPGITSFFGPGTAGNVLVSNGAGAPTYNNTLTLAGTTPTSSAATGALTVAGGVGVGGGLVVGGTTTSTNIEAGGTAFGSVYLTQYASVFAEGGASVSNVAMQASANNLASGIGVASLNGSNSLYSSGGINFTTNRTLRDRDTPQGGNTFMSLSTAGVLTLSGNVASTSNTTGALTVAGGVGISGDVYIGGTIFGTVSGSITTSSNLTSGVAGQIPIQLAPGVTAFISTGSVGDLLQQQTGNTATFVSTSTIQVGYSVTATNIAAGSTGQLLYQSTAGITSFVSTNIAGNVLVSNGAAAPSYNNTLNLSGTTSATSVASGALVVAGGVGIGGNLYVAGEIVAQKLTIELTTVTTTFVTTDDIISTYNATASTGTTTGALTVVGGVGVGGNIYAGNDMYSKGNLVLTTATVNQFASQITISAGTDTAVNTSTGNIVIWNTSNLQTVTDRGYTTTNQIRINNTLASTSSFSTNALYVAGGIGGNSGFNINGDGYLHGDLTVYGTITGTNLTLNVLTANSGTFYGDETGSGALYAGVLGHTPFAQTMAQFTGDLNDYMEINVQNINAGGKASTDIIASADNVSENNAFIDMGITSSGWDGTQPDSFNDNLGPNDGYLLVGANTTPGYGDLVIGTLGSGTNVRIIVAGTSTNYLTAYFDTADTEALSTNTGALVVHGGIGLSGNVYAGGVITATNFYGNLTGAATKIAGGSTGSLVMQSASGTTTFIPLGTPGYVLTANATTATWSALLGLAAGRSTTATNLDLGTAGQIPYQTALGVTAFFGPGTTGTVLVSNGTNAPAYQNTLTLTGTATSLSTTTGALQVVGGVGIGGSVYVGNRVGFVNTGNVSTVYQYYNAATNSLDTVFG